MIRRCYSSLLGRVVVFGLALTFVTSCATQRQVRDIVSQSDVLTLLATVEQPQPSGIPAPPGAAKEEGWVEVSGRIDQFILEHPEQKKTVAALRIRQAVLLLSYEQYALARAAFEQASAADLDRGRDKALKALQERILWWFAFDKGQAPPPEEVERCVKQFTEVIESLNAEEEPENIGIRDYLAEMLVWIEVQAAQNELDEARLSTRLAEGVNRYVATLTDHDLDAINKGKPSAEAEGGPFSLQVRRQIRAMLVIARAQQILEDAEKPVPFSERAAKLQALNADP